MNQIDFLIKNLQELKEQGHTQIEYLLWTTDDVKVIFESKEMAFDEQLIFETWEWVNAYLQKAINCASEEVYMDLTDAIESSMQEDPYEEYVMTEFKVRDLMCGAGLGEEAARVMVALNK